MGHVHMYMYLRYIVVALKKEEIGSLFEIRNHKIFYVRNLLIQQRFDYVILVTQYYYDQKYFINDTLLYVY